MTKYILSLIVFCTIAVNAIGQEKDKKEAIVICTYEKMPEYPGGEKALYKYLSENISYPKNALDSAIDGVVYVEFVVCQDGALCEVKTRQDIGGGCGLEAMRAVKKMPNWKPGMQSGKPVRTSFTLPIDFSMTEKDKKKALKNLNKEK